MRISSLLSSVAIASALALTACGGGGSSSTNTNNNSNNKPTNPGGTQPPATTTPKACKVDGSTVTITGGEGCLYKKQGGTGDTVYKCSADGKRFTVDGNTLSSPFNLTVAGKDTTLQCQSSTQPPQGAAQPCPASADGRTMTIPYGGTCTYQPPGSSGQGVLPISCVPNVGLIITGLPPQYATDISKWEKDVRGYRFKCTPPTP